MGIQRRQVYCAEEYPDSPSQPPQTDMNPARNGSVGPNFPPPSEWRYRIEGGQKVFFSRSAVSRALGAEAMPRTLCVDLSSRLPDSRHKRRERDVHQVLFRRYLGRYLLRPTPVRLPKPYLLVLADAAEALRPAARRRVNDFSTASPNAELYPDLALRFGRETTLVELKPKCGILSRSALVHPQITDSLQKFSVPPYYFKNYLFPHGSDEIGKLPDAEHRYDPMKMLSGSDIGRQLMILHAEKARGLRLFERGSRLDHVEDIHECNDGFCHTVLKVAAKALADVSSKGESCLRGLRAVQNHDYIDNIGAGLLLQRLMEQVGKSQAYEMVEEYAYQDDNDVLRMEKEEEFLVSKSVLSYETPEEGRRLHSHERYARATEEVKRMRPRVCARMLADFIQAAAAKDCSLMISLCVEEKAEYKYQNVASSDEHFGFVHHGSHRWLYCVHIIDVGLKNLDKILGKWPAMDFKTKNQLFSAGGLDNLL